MFGNGSNGAEQPAQMELVRLALPRRVYTKEHIEYATEAIKRVYARAATLNGMRIKKQAKRLRHFTAEFEYVNDSVPMTMWAVVMGDQAFIEICLERRSNKYLET